jgi:hypothetical protein
MIAEEALTFRRADARYALEVFRFDLVRYVAICIHSFSVGASE